MNVFNRNIVNKMILSNFEMELETKDLLMRIIKNEESEIHYKIKNGCFYIFDFKLKQEERDE